MPDQFNTRLKLFSHSNKPSLTEIQRGIEKESLRITPTGKLALTRHPAGLGSALTHPYITTDFSEALLELITPVSSSIDATLDCLDRVHRKVYSELEEEQLWSASMPCVLGNDEDIPVAVYGSSNIATMKTTYRKGLGHRYGRLMQTIAGIHYNFSLPDAMWQDLKEQDNNNQTLQDFKTTEYFNLIRNFRRLSWLLIYLYGASPAVCKSFLKGREHQLESFDKGSVYLPFGTSLRMGDLGYQSNAQENLEICYNNIDNYIETLRQAIINIHPDYEKIGEHEDGEYRQLSTALLQIENEFYSPIRPKRVTNSGEIPLGALHERGVEYIEVRCIDVNPYLPLGIDADQVRFLDCFLLYSLFQPSPLCNDDDRQRINDNLKKVVNEGRKPKLQLQNSHGPINLSDWAGTILDGIHEIAVTMDKAHGGNDYQRVVAQQRDKISDPELTPSAKILHDMQTQGKPFFHFAMDLTQQHADHFKNNPLSTEQQQYFEQQRLASLKKQQQIEDNDSESFSEYLANYYRQYETLK